MHGGRTTVRQVHWEGDNLVVTVDVNGGERLTIFYRPYAVSFDRLPEDKERRSEVDADALQALIVSELEAGERSRVYLNTVAKKALGASKDQTYTYGLKPLRDAEQIRVEKDSLEGGWYWSLANTPEPLPVEESI